MIYPGVSQTADGVASHYDELDIAYRRIWGEHVHHGYWQTGRESSAEAANALVTLVEKRLELSPGQKVCDIGCGYGATAAHLAAHCGVSVTGLTISSAQEEVGRQRNVPGLTILRRDWLDNGLPDASFDRAYAIESSEHMVDKARFFAEAWRVLRPGGRFVVCAWLEGEGASGWRSAICCNPSAAKAVCLAWAVAPITRRWRKNPGSRWNVTTTSAAMCGAPGQSACAALPGGW